MPSDMQIKKTKKTPLGECFSSLLKIEKSVIMLFTLDGDWLEGSCNE